MKPAVERLYAWTACRSGAGISIIGLTEASQQQRIANVISIRAAANGLPTTALVKGGHRVTLIERAPQVNP